MCHQAKFISSKSLEPWQRYGDSSIFQDGGRRHLDFQNLKFLVFETVKKVELHIKRAKIHRNRSNLGRDM